MSSEAYAERLANALSSTGLAEPVNSTFSADRVSVLLRVKLGVEKQWNDLIRSILLATEFYSKQAHTWNSHICRTYFLGSGKNKNLVFGWNITITSRLMGGSLDEIIRVIHGGNPEPQADNPNELTEFPLIGAQRERNVPGKTGKGASTIGGNSDFRPPIRR